MYIVMLELFNFKNNESWLVLIRMLELNKISQVKYWILVRKTGIIFRNKLSFYTSYHRRKRILYPSYSIKIKFFQNFFKLSTLQIKNLSRTLKWWMYMILSLMIISWIHNGKKNTFPSWHTPKIPISHTSESKINDV